MTSKMITIRQEVYDRLKRAKRGGESFSEVIVRLLDERGKDPLRHFGIGAGDTGEVHETFQEGIESGRETSRARSRARHDETWGG